MVRGMTLNFKQAYLMRPGYQIADTMEHDILMKASVVEKDMIVLAVMQENSQEGLRAGSGGTR